MPVLKIKGYGKGRYISKNALRTDPGYAADSLNFLHTRGEDTAILRPAVDRTWATRPANARTIAAFEYVKSDGTKILLTKVGSQLYTFTLGITGALTSILTGMDSTHIPQMCNANGFVFIADWQAKNYISNGTSGETHELQSATVTGAFTLASAGVATGNPAGTVGYAYTRVDTTTGEESPPSATVTVARTLNQGVTVTNVSLSFTAPYTTINLYRYAPGSTQFYLVASGLTSGSFPYADVALDSALTTASPVHDTVAAASIEKPEAAKHCVFFRGRLVFGNLTGKPSRIRWSKPLQPTQFSNASTARLDVGLNDGGEITGLCVFRGALVIFKTNSIWVMNGDVDETAFTLAPMVPGKGCVASRTIVADGDQRILFLSDCGLLSFDMQSVPEVPLSDPIRDDVVALDFANRADFFCAGLDLCRHTYLLSVTPTGGPTTNTKTHVLNLNNMAWGRADFNIGSFTPSCYSSMGDSSTGPIHNAAAGRANLYFGSEDGYLYQWDATTGADGVASGTHQATVTGYAANVTTASAAAFRTTGNGLTGIGMTLRRAADNSYETVVISSNTATAITHAAFVGANPAVGDTIWVGAFQGTLALNGIDLETGRRKRWTRLEAEVQKQSHTIPLRVGYTLDGGSTPTATAEFDTSTRYAARLPIHRRGTAIAPYFDIIGTDHATEILGADVHYELLAARLPT